ncbi:hypothetical protein [Microvirga alba]|uniref:Uncharacterized protein n=1 Tax=Microvirga alba TaxID=2791025 RepID=A0A931BTZ5_9HYPH|nr:hypothetical protein [Microvirga alba]MBF9232787.1 hypothetical protein [Microvirga alba]
MGNQPGSGRGPLPTDKSKPQEMPRKGEQPAPSKEHPSGEAGRKGGQTPQGGHR